MYSPPYSSCATIQTKAELHGARYAVLSEDKGFFDEALPATPPHQFQPEGCSADTPMDELPPVLSRLLRTHSIDGMESAEQNSQWQACSYTLSVAEGILPEGNGKMPTKSQLKALSNVLTSKITQCAPNVRLPKEGFVIKAVLVDSVTYNTVLRWIQHLTVHSPIKNTTPVKRSLEHSSKHEIPKKARLVSNNLRKKIKAQNGGQVKSSLELERELNKAAHRRMMDYMCLESGHKESLSMHKMALQEAESVLEMAREQLKNKCLDEERVIGERTELDTELSKKRRASDEEYLHVEDTLRSLQYQLEQVHGRQPSSMPPNSEGAQLS